MFVSFCFCLFSLEFLRASNRSDARTHTHIGRDWIILIKTHTDPVASFLTVLRTFCGQSKNTMIWLIFIGSRGARNHAACAPISGRSEVRYKNAGSIKCKHKRNRGFMGEGLHTSSRSPRRGRFLPGCRGNVDCSVAMVSESFWLLILKMQIKLDNNGFYDRDCCLIFNLMNIILFFDCFKFPTITFN